MVTDSTDGEAWSEWSTVGLESLSLIVAWRVGAHLTCASVPITVRVADELRGICRATLDRLDQLDRRPWHPDAANETDEYLSASIAQLGEDSQVLDIVNRTEFDLLRADQLPSYSFLFYMLVVGPVDHRVSFIRKYNVRRGLRQRLVTVFTDMLNKVDSPLFTFDDGMDVVVDPTRGAAILGLSAFELLFRSSPEMLARTPEYVAEIADSLPISAASMQTLVDAAGTNVSINRRLRAIVERGHLQFVSMRQIEDEMKRHGIDPRDFIVDGKLTFDKAQSRDILKLLNEDLFRGGLTNQDFQVDRKSPR